MNINLITSYYQDETPEHQDEINQCLLKNLDNRFISNITVITTIPVPFQHPKLTAITDLTRFNFSKAYSVADGIAIISNSDIYFDESINYLHKIDFNNLIIAITKRDIVDNKILESRHFTYENGMNFRNTWMANGKLYCAGADSWVFVPPLINFNTDIILGTNNCDHLIVKRAYAAKINILNGFKFIKSYHLHYSNYRKHRFTYDVGTNHSPYHLSVADYLPIKRHKLFL